MLLALLTCAELEFFVMPEEPAMGVIPTKSIVVLLFSSPFTIEEGFLEPLLTPLLDWTRELV